MSIPVKGFYNWFFHASEDPFLPVHQTTCCPKFVTAFRFIFFIYMTALVMIDQATPGSTFQFLKYLSLHG